MLVLLYYLSQNPDFPESVKPIMGQLKNSEQMLSFLNELSQFSQTFSSFQKKSENKTPPPPNKEKGEHKEEQKEKPQSPTSGIADAFIQQMLDSYLKNNAK